MKKQNIAFEIMYGHIEWVPGDNWTALDGWDSGSYSIPRVEGKVIVIAENEKEARNIMVLKHGQSIINVREVTIP